jgi:RNA polymerase subunit RPABC4/transcription elongation factor Spt4
MSEIHFRDNYHDLSTNSGFQFEFYCERCHDAWRSPFDRYAAGTVEGMLGAAENLFGGLFGSARNALNNVASAGYSTAKDGALREASKQAAAHFHRCPRCSQNMCDACWNEDEGVCITCVPRLDAELSAIRREAKIAAVREAAYSKATASDADLQDRAVSCRDCGAPVGRAKFCPECGTAVSLTRACKSCNAEMPTSSKFCPECGAKS